MCYRFVNGVGLQSFPWYGLFLYSVFVLVCTFVAMMSFVQVRATCHGISAASGKLGAATGTYMCALSYFPWCLLVTYIVFADNFEYK